MISLTTKKTQGRLIPLKAGNPLKGTSANGEDPDEMPHHAAFHQGLHCLLTQNRLSEKEIQHF